MDDYYIWLWLNLQSEVKIKKIINNNPISLKLYPYDSQDPELE